MSRGIIRNSALWRLCRARHRRHTFAVNTLLKIKQRGGSPQQALPVLADYLGHSVYKYTAVYLRVADAISRKRLVDFALWQIKKV